MTVSVVRGFPSPHRSCQSCGAQTGCDCRAEEIFISLEIPGEYKERTGEKGRRLGELRRLLKSVDCVQEKEGKWVPGPAGDASATAARGVVCCWCGCSCHGSVPYFEDQSHR